MKTIIIFLFCLLSSIIYSQTPYNLKVSPTAKLTDSVLANGKHELTIKADSNIRFLGSVRFPKIINGDVNITGDFKINGVSIGAGSGDMLKTTYDPTSVERDVFDRANHMGDFGIMETGTWQADLIQGKYGGTGINNDGKTITLANNLVTAGNFSLTLTQTGTTNVTLPTSGTLETQNNKSQSAGYVGLTGDYEIVFKDFAGDYASYLKNNNDHVCDYTFQNRSGTIADLTDIAGRQPLDAELTTLASLNAIDLDELDMLVWEFGTWINKSPAGVKTTLNIGNVENTALSTWTGSTSITTLGTIGAGLWRADLVEGKYGGTGINNDGKTITLGNNLITAGNHSLTLTQTAATNVTLPNSGTLISAIDNGITLGTVKILWGSGSPNGIEIGDPGWLYIDTDGFLWSKATGAETNTGWVKLD